MRQRKKTKSVLPNMLRHRQDLLASSSIGKKILFTSLHRILTFFCRISDFHVNEIDFDGKICKLTDLSLPETPKGDTDSGEKHKCASIYIIFFFFRSADDTAEATNSDHFKELISLEKFNEILEIENADKKCDKDVFVSAAAAAEEMDKFDIRLIPIRFRSM